MHACSRACVRVGVHLDMPSEPCRIVTVHIRWFLTYFADNVSH